MNQKITPQPHTAMEVAWLKAMQKYAAGKKSAPSCPKCGGAGWLWWKELDNYSGPATQGGVDDTRYLCDACGVPGK